MLSRPLTVNDNVYLAAVSVAITFVEICRTLLLGETVNCEREGRNAEDPYAVALWEGWCYRWPHPCAISCTCMLFLACDGAIQCIVTGPRKYSGI